MSGVVPPNEEQRLAVLHSLHILDTAPEIPFELLTQMARTHFGVPIAVVSLLDGDRQWFKSHPGLGISATPRDVAFCAHTIRGDGIFEVPDAARHADFCATQLVARHPGVHYYCGAPIVVRHQKIGAFAIMALEPRPRLGEADRRFLEALAALCAHLFVTHRLLHESAGRLAAELQPHPGGVDAD